MKAGQAWRRSSCCQPGKAAKSEGVISGAGAGLTGSVGKGSATTTGGGMVTGGAGAGTGAGAGRGGSGVVHADRASAPADTETSKLRRIEDIRIAMWLLMVEAGIALFLLVFIVWWTMYSGKKPDQLEHEAAPAEKKDPPETPGA